MARSKPTSAAPAVHPEDVGMIKEGDPKGSPSVRFDPETRQNYQLNRKGERVFHQVPEGFTLDDNGVPVAIPDPAED